MNQHLHFVVKLLLQVSQFAVRDRVRLKSERGGHAVLIAAKYIRERGPTAGDLSCSAASVITIAGMTVASTIAGNARASLRTSSRSAQNRQEEQ